MKRGVCVHTRTSTTLLHVSLDYFSFLVASIRFLCFTLAHTQISQMIFFNSIVPSMSFTKFTSHHWHLWSTHRQRCGQGWVVDQSGRGWRSRRHDRLRPHVATGTSSSVWHVEHWRGRRGSRATKPHAIVVGGGCRGRLAKPNSSAHGRLHNVQ